MLALLHSDVASAILKRVACKSWRDLIPLACVSRGALSVVRVAILEEQRAEILTREMVHSISNECAARMLRFTHRVGNAAATCYTVEGCSNRQRNIANGNDLYGQVSVSFGMGNEACVTVSRMGMYTAFGWTPANLDDLSLDDINVQLETTKAGSINVFNWRPIMFHGLDEMWLVLDRVLQCVSWSMYK
jgi:hypothetical protein